MSAYAAVTAVTNPNQPGILFGLTRVLANHSANITHVDIIPHQDRDGEVYLEFSIDEPIEPIVAELAQVPGVSRVEVTPSFSKIYGKRIVIMGGGAQVGQVALGAISEADRHNIRGERISVDTIPLVVKFFSKPGPYDTLLDREEVKFDRERQAFLTSFNRYMKELTESKLLHLTQHKPLERALIEGVDRSRAAKEFLEHLMELERSFDEKIRAAREAAATSGITFKADMLEDMARAFYADLRQRMETFFRDDRRTPATARA